MKSRDDLRVELCGAMTGLEIFIAGRETDPAVCRIFMEIALRETRLYMAEAEKLDSLEASCSQAQPSAN